MARELNMNNVLKFEKEYEPQHFDKTADYVSADKDGIYLHQSGFGKTDLCDLENLDNFIDALNNLKGNNRDDKQMKYIELEINEEELNFGAFSDKTENWDEAHKENLFDFFNDAIVTRGDKKYKFIGADVHTFCGIGCANFLLKEIE
jgi:hypothetical protein